MLNRPGGFREPGEPDEYCRGFQVFDKDMTGFIGVGQLKYILTNLGEKMTEDEVDELLKAVDTSSGQVNYTGMCLFLPPAFDMCYWGYVANLWGLAQSLSGRFSRTEGELTMGGFEMGGGGLERRGALERMHGITRIL